MSNFNFSEDLLVDVLSRLPAKTLARFNLVSKSWRDLIHSRSFRKLNLNRLESCNSKPKIVFACQGDGFTKLSTLDCNKLIPDDKKLHYPLLEGRNEITGGVELLGSSNGLLCLHYSYRRIVLWNPLTQQRREISRPKISSKRALLCTYGFGYEKASDDYKMVALMVSSGDYKYGSEGIHEGWMYSLRLRKWKRVENFSYRLRFDQSGVLVSGALHWITLDGLLLGFNLADEKFYTLPQPIHFGDIFCLNVGRLDGCLSLICKSSKGLRVEIWVMKDYGVKDSWTLISDLELFQGYWILRPVAYGLSNKRVIVVEDLGHQRLLFYDIITRQNVGREIYLCQISEAYPYFETLECFECYEIVGKSRK